uniref:HDC17210 n=1 Tax=Drosophila melanogaster TaxID=7227 RepID=Q6IIS6_DROME|nr:TPA_inf: HDC17210 [Drosophila melanogaster]
MCICALAHRNLISMFWMFGLRPRVYIIYDGHLEALVPLLIAVGTACSCQPDLHILEESPQVVGVLRWQGCSAKDQDPIEIGLDVANDRRRKLLADDGAGISIGSLSYLATIDAQKDCVYHTFA